MPRIRPDRFVHVVYRTRQFDKMIAWYQAVFDCKVQYQDPVLAFLTYDDEHHRVGRLRGRRKPERLFACAVSGNQLTMGIRHVARRSHPEALWH